jgi:hypothetical protein
VGPSWSPSPGPINQARWCFSMTATGNMFMALPMINADKTGRKKRYVINPAIKALPNGFSNIGGLITGGTYQPLTPRETSFLGKGHERTAIGWTADGDFFLVAMSASNTGVSDWNTVQDFFRNTLRTLAVPGYNIGPITNAFMLDGGGSTQFAYTNNFQDVLGGYSNIQSDDGGIQGDGRYLTSIIGLQWP